MRRIAFDRQSIFIVFFAFVLSLILGAAGKAKADPFSSKDDASLPSVVLASEKTVSRFQHEIVLQKYVGNSACGPCSIFNAFQFGDAALTNLAWSLPGKTAADKVDSLIEMFGGKPSVLAHDQPRYLADGGMWGEDIAPFINDWLRQENPALTVRGERLALQWNETPRKQLRRIYGELRRSLQGGFPPIVNLQSYTVQSSPAQSDWNWLDGHFVTVLAVQDSLAKDAPGFSMWVADSETGHVLQVSVSAGQDHPSAAATRGAAARNGKTMDGGTAGHPWLIIRSPKLEGIMAGSAPSPQTVCVLQYIVCR